MHICSEPVFFGSEGTLRPPTGTVQHAVTWPVCVVSLLIYVKCEDACTARIKCVFMSIHVLYVYMCVSVYCTVCASCPVLPSGTTCNGDKLLLLASRGFTADLFQVCVCGLCEACARLGGGGIQIS